MLRSINRALSALAVLFAVAGAAHSQVTRTVLPERSYSGVGSNAIPGVVVHSDCKRAAILRNGKLEILDLATQRVLETVWEQREAATKFGWLAKTKSGFLIKANGSDAFALLLQAGDGRESAAYVFDSSAWEQHAAKPKLVAELPSNLGYSAMTGPRALFKSDPQRLVFAAQPSVKARDGKSSQIKRNQGAVFVLDVESGTGQYFNVPGEAGVIWDLPGKDEVSVVLGKVGSTTGRLVHLDLASRETRNIRTGTVPSPFDAYLGVNSMQAAIPVFSGPPDAPSTFLTSLVFQNEQGRTMIPVRPMTQNKIFALKWSGNGKWVAYIAALDFAGTAAVEKSNYRVCVRNLDHPAQFQASEPRKRYLANGNGARDLEWVAAVSDNGDYVVTTAGDVHDGRGFTETIVYRFPQDSASDSQSFGNRSQQ